MAKLKIENIPYGLYPKLKQLVEEHNCNIEKEVWQSKYDNYVKYSHQPACTVGFDLTVELEGSNLAKLKFIGYLFNRIIENIDKLECLLKQEDICAT